MAENNSHSLSHSSVGSEPGPARLDSLLRVSRLKSGWVGLFSCGSGEESALTLIQVVGRIYFLVAVGLRFPFPCWLLCCPLLEAFFWSLHVTFSILRASNGALNSFESSLSDFSFSHQLEKAPCSEGLL